jgi:tRNA/rRNA methyltransferase
MAARKKPAGTRSPAPAAPGTKIRVILVEPEGEVNLGSAARAMANFGTTDLRLVRPKAKPGPQARMFAKHAWPTIQKARRAKTLAEAARGCTMVVGTTGVPRRFWRGIKNCLTPREFSKKATETKGTIALVFGNEGTGLSEGDLKECDAIVSIPTDGEYPVMNLSHAVAVMLYEASHASQKEGLYEPAARGKLERLQKMFAETLALAPTVHDKGKVARAFGQILARARPADDEVQALFAAASGLKKAIREKGKRA